MPRVTAATKEATRARILEAGRESFVRCGFAETTTRDIARQAGIAAGTLFNYFTSKEEIVLQLMSEALLARTEKAFLRRRRDGSSLEEDLFLFVSTGLRQLKPLRRFIAPALETNLSPASQDTSGPGPAIRVGHLEFLAGLLSQHGLAEPPTGMQLQMYWVLYTGVLSFWARDESRKQENTLALLDQSIGMFITWLRMESSDPS